MIPRTRFNRIQPAEVLFSVTLSILLYSVFQLHKIHTNCISITKYKLLLARQHNTKYIKCMSVSNTYFKLIVFQLRLRCPSCACYRPYI